MIISVVCGHPREIKRYREVEQYLDAIQGCPLLMGLTGK
jgi:hypothetical protein